MSGISLESPLTSHCGCGGGRDDASTSLFIRDSHKASLLALSLSRYWQNTARLLRCCAPKHTDEYSIDSVRVARAFMIMTLNLNGSVGGRKSEQLHVSLSRRGTGKMGKTSTDSGISLDRYLWISVGDDVSWVKLCEETTQDCELVPT